MIASGHGLEATAILTERGAAELAAPDHERLIEETALFQILQQRRDGLVRDAGVRGEFGIEIAVLVPGRKEERHEACPALDETSREETVAGEGTLESRLVRRVTFTAVESVGLAGCLALAREINQLGRGRLHAEGQFVVFDPRRDLRMTALFITPLIERVDRLDTASLHRRGDAVGRVEIQDRAAAAAEKRARVVRREEPARPARRASGKAASQGGQHDVTRQVA